MKRLLTYAETKHIFGWKSTSSIRKYVRSGDLVRVQLNAGMASQRITEESALAFIERLKSKYEQEAYAVRAAKHTEHMRRTCATESVTDEVLLDAEDIIRQSRVRTPEPKPQQTLDDYLAEKRDAEAPVAESAARPRSAGLGFHSVRGL